MADLDKIKELIKNGVGARKAAKLLGVSRQRLYQVAAKHKLKWPYNPHAARGTRSRWREPLPPKPRLITGGIAVPISHSVAGKVAEMLVAADLLARGWQVFLPTAHISSHDIVAARGERLITIEVRSAHRELHNNKIVFNRKAKCISSHYGLAITGEPVVYQPSID